MKRLPVRVSNQDHEGCKHQDVCFVIFPPKAELSGADQFSVSESVTFRFEVQSINYRYLLAGMFPSTCSIEPHSIFSERSSMH